jgi:hypothetical protein
VVRSAARPRCRRGGERSAPDQARRAQRGALPRRAKRLMPCRCAEIVAGGAIGCEAVDAAMVASGASIKPGEPGEALHGEALHREALHGEALHREALTHTGTRSEQQFVAQREPYDSYN